MSSSASRPGTGFIAMWKYCQLRDRRAGQGSILATVYLVSVLATVYLVSVAHLPRYRGAAMAYPRDVACIGLATISVHRALEGGCGLPCVS